MSDKRPSKKKIASLENAITSVDAAIAELIGAGLQLHQYNPKLGACFNDEIGVLRAIQNALRDELSKHTEKPN